LTVCTISDLLIVSCSSFAIKYLVIKLFHAWCQTPWLMNIQPQQFLGSIHCSIHPTGAARSWVL
jgi:hypothetical protein